MVNTIKKKIKNRNNKIIKQIKKLILVLKIKIPKTVFNKHKQYKINIITKMITIFIKNNFLILKILIKFQCKKKKLKMKI